MTTKDYVVVCAQFYCRICFVPLFLAGMLDLEVLNILRKCQGSTIMPRGGWENHHNHHSVYFYSQYVDAPTCIPRYHFKSCSNCEVHSPFFLQRCESMSPLFVGLARAPVTLTHSFLHLGTLLRYFLGHAHTCICVCVCVCVCVCACFLLCEVFDCSEGISIRRAVWRKYWIQSCLV